MKIRMFVVMLVVLVMLSMIPGVAAKEEMPMVTEVVEVNSKQYVLKEDGIYCCNPANGEGTIFVEDAMCGIYGSYGDRYLYYGKTSEEDIGRDLYVYDTETQQNTLLYSGIGKITIVGNKIYMIGTVGDISGTNFCVADVDGSNNICIEENALPGSIVFIEDEIYYSRFYYEKDTYLSRIKKYDMKSGKISDLTDYFIGYVSAEDINSERAIVRKSPEESHSVHSIINFLNDVTYVEENGIIYETNVETDYRKAICSDADCIIDVYKDKYLYVERAKDDSGVAWDIVIYDLDTFSEVGVIEYGDLLKIHGDRIYTQGSTSDVSPTDLTSYKVDGTDERIISLDMASSSAHIIDHYVYYCEFENEVYDKPTGIVKRYDILTDTAEVLVERRNGIAQISPYDVEGAWFISNGGIEHEYEYYVSDADRDIKVSLNGEALTFDRTPINYKDRVMVPIRAIFEALGYEVSWDEQTNTAIATNGTNTIYTAVGNCAIKYNGGIYYSDVAPINVGGRVMVPVRAIAESSRCIVGWDGTTKTVSISE